MNETPKTVMGFWEWLFVGGGGSIAAWFLRRHFTGGDREHADLHQLIATLQAECKRMADENAAERLRADKWQEISERLQPLITTQKLELWLGRRTRRDVAQCLEHALQIIHSDTPGCEVMVSEAVDKLREDIVLPIDTEPK